MIADFPYRSRAYSQLPPAPPAMAAMTYRPMGGGGVSKAKNRATSPAAMMAEKACTKMSILGAYHG